MEVDSKWLQNQNSQHFQGRKDTNHYSIVLFNFCKHRYVAYDHRLNATSTKPIAVILAFRLILWEQNS